MLKNISIMIFFFLAYLIAITFMAKRLAIFCKNSLIVYSLTGTLRVKIYLLAGNNANEQIVTTRSAKSLEDMSRLEVFSTFKLSF